MSDSKELIEARKKLNHLIESPVEVEKRKAFLNEIETTAKSRQLSGSEINKLVEEVRQNSKAKAKAKNTPWLEDFLAKFEAIAKKNKQKKQV